MLLWDRANCASCSVVTLSRSAAPRGPKSLPVTEVEPLGIGKQHKMWLIKPYESIKLVANTIAPNATAAR